MTHLIDFKKNVIEELTAVCDLHYRPVPEMSPKLDAEIKELFEGGCSVFTAADLIIELGY